MSVSLGLVNDFLRGLKIKVTVLLAEANNNQLCLKGEGWINNIPDITKVMVEGNICINKYDTYLPDFTNITIVIEVSKLCWVGLIPTENNKKKINKRREIMHWIAIYPNKEYGITDFSWLY